MEEELDWLEMADGRKGSETPALRTKKMFQASWLRTWRDKVELLVEP
jgi:hypothetical protein